MNDPTETKTIIEVFDPAMCCSTGVCGPDVDDALAEFANDVKWLKSQGIDVKRYNLGQEPEAFKSNPAVLSRLKQAGSDILPLIFVNEVMVSESGYPNRKQLMEWTSIKSRPISNKADITADNTDELLNKLEDAVSRGDEPELRSLFVKAEALGIPVQSLVNTLQSGINNRQRVTQSTLRTANQLLGVSSNGCAPGSGCC